MIRVRRATLDDIEPMVSAYTAAWRSGFQYMLPPAVFEADDFDSTRRGECSDSVLLGGTDTFVAELGERVAGYVVARPDGQDSIIDDLWVHPSSWGRGVAAALIARAEDDMRSRGGRLLSAWVPEDSPTGRRFFDKLGWRPSGEVDRLQLADDDDNRLIEYLRELESVDLTRGIPRPTRSLQRAQPRPASLDNH
jgi:GNAT superfamily N-acetyltransferase